MEVKRDPNGDIHIHITNINNNTNSNVNDNANTNDNINTGEEEQGSSFIGDLFKTAAIAVVTGALSIWF